MLSAKSASGVEIAAPEKLAFPNVVQFFALLAAYFGLHILIRSFLFEAAELDEGEQLLLTQGRAWMQSTDPPLYTWVQTLAFQLFGLNLAALAIVKNVLLFGTYALTYASARVLAIDHPRAVLAAASLLFVPQIAWESQRDLTHSVLATTLAAFTLMSFIGAFERRTRLWYVALGLSASLGTLSKYSYLVFFFGLAAGALSIRRWRSVLFDSRIISTISLLAITAALLTSGILGEADSPLAATKKLSTPSVTLGSRAAALGRFGINLLIFCGPVTLLYFFSFRDRSAGDPQPVRYNVHQQWLRLGFVIIVSVMVLMAVGLGVSNVKERWLQPLATLLPMLLLLGKWPDPTLQASRRLLLGAALVGLLVLTVLALGSFAPAFGRPTRLNAPFRQLAIELQKLRFPADTYLAEDRWLGGNLRLRIPGKLCLAPELPIQVPQTCDHLLVIWNASRREALPESLSRAMAGLRFAAETNASSYIEASYPYAAGRKLKLGILPAHRVGAASN